MAGEMQENKLKCEGRNNDGIVKKIDKAKQRKRYQKKKRKMTIVI